MMIKRPFLKKILPFLFLPAVFQYAYGQQAAQVRSPDGNIVVTVTPGDSIRLSIRYREQQVLLPSPIELRIKDGPRLSGRAKPLKTRIRSVRSVITPAVPQKRKVIPDHYNELTIRYRQPFSLIVRAYDDGVAYRWETRLKDTIVIEGETARYSFPGNPAVYFPRVEKREDADIYHTSFEAPYTVKPVDSLTRDLLCFSPVLVAPRNGPKIVITESDLQDYPGMFFSGGDGALQGRFAPYPLEETITGGEFPQAVVTKRADYIARTKGNRAFPWRVFLIAREDRELPGNDLVYRLAAPSSVKDVSWIHPGKGTDEWIIGINLFNIPFKAGVNTETYKYYIDFAKRFGFDRIMMDAGWSDYTDLFRIRPGLDMDTLAAYARSRGIKLSMWTLSLTLQKQLEPALEQFNKWGVDFIMTDFMDRDDQQMVDFYTKVAAACARHKIMIMYHGAFKPAGFGRTWPNAITRESVLGSEYNIWSGKATPEHDLLLPFIRMTAGPLDYEPGLLDNATQSTFRPIGGRVMSQGTRCHQLAMFVVYDSPMQIFSGNPSQGLLEPRFMELLGSIPTTWDTTVIVAGRLGDYIITARRKGADWYIGAMTDWTARDLTIPLDFIGEGTFNAGICEDGVNADRYAADYRLEHRSLTKNDSLKISMAPGGGYMVRLRKK